MTETDIRYVVGRQARSKKKYAVFRLSIHDGVPSQTMMESFDDVGDAEAYRKELEDAL